MVKIAERKPLKAVGICRFLEERLSKPEPDIRAAVREARELLRSLEAAVREGRP